MKVLITGSNGFIGTTLISRLKREHCIIRHGKSDAKNPNMSGYYKINIDSQSNWEDCLAGVNVVVHLAAVAHNTSSDSSYINEVNVKGTTNLAQQAVKMGVQRFIFISSIGVLGNSTLNRQPFDENSVALPHSQCTQSKLDAENALLHIARTTDLEVVIIRPALVYGIGAPGNFGKLVNLVRKSPVLPFALCTNKRSFVSVDNLADFISVCIEHSKAKNEIFCISDGTDLSIKDFTNSIANGLNKKLLQLPIPNLFFYILGKAMRNSTQVDQLIGDLQVDSKKARLLLGWKPPFTMTETLKNFSE